jgi:hypothetical protein
MNENNHRMSQSTADAVALADQDADASDLRTDGQSCLPDARSMARTVPDSDGTEGASAPLGIRPHVRGKFVFVGEEKFYVRGVTYGTFRPNDAGAEFPVPEVVECDFAQMAANGVNAVRTYTPPPLWLLDTAQRHGLRIMAGLPVERSVAFVDYRKCARSIEEMVRTEVGTLAGHPAILCYTIGNEIPASIVRWHGRRRLERFLERLYEVLSPRPAHLFR